MPNTEVTSIADLIERLGGLSVAARAFGEAPQTVWNWKERKRIPARLYMEHSKVLRRHKISAPMCLWGFKGAVAEVAA